MNDTDQYDADSAPSKSQLKRDMSDLRDLGEILTTLPASILEKCKLPDALADAVESYGTIPKKHGARRRQLQFIGKLMRELSDTELQQIQAQLHQNVDLEKKRFHELEQLRDRLLADDKAALDDVIATHPDLNIQQLRQLIRQARKESDENQSPTSARKLFQLLRDMQD